MDKKMIPLIVMVGIIGLIALIVIVPGHTPTEGATSGSASGGGTITPDGEMVLITPEESKNPVVTDLKKWFLSGNWVDEKLRRQ